MRMFEFPFPITMMRLHKVLSHNFGVSPKVNITTATASVSEEHAGKIIHMNRAAGCAITLPPATGSGNKWRFRVGTTMSGGNAVIKVANSSDTMEGWLVTSTTTGATTNGFSEACAATDDTITMNGTTLGGIVGSWVEVTDIDVNKFHIEGHLVGSGTLASSLSAAV
jgi:hypothetical protein